MTGAASSAPGEGAGKFEALRVALESADTKIKPEEINLNIKKVETLFKKAEAAVAKKAEGKDGAEKAYGELIVQEKDRFEKLQDGNEVAHVEALRSAVFQTLAELHAFCTHNEINAPFLNESREYATVTGVRVISDEWREGDTKGFSSLQSIISAHLPNIGEYGNENYRKALYIFLNQRKDGAPGKGALYDIQNTSDREQWDRAQAEAKQVQKGEEFDFWAVRVALKSDWKPGEQYAPLPAPTGLKSEIIAQPDLIPKAGAGAVTVGATIEQPEVKKPRESVKKKRAPRTAPKPEAEAALAAAPELNPQDAEYLESVATRLQKVIGDLGTAESGKEIQAVVGNMEALSREIAGRIRKNPGSEAMRNLLVNQDVQLTQILLAIRQGTAEARAEAAAHDTQGFWSHLKVLNAIPKAYRAVSGDGSVKTYSEVRSEVMADRARDVTDASNGAALLSEILETNPEMSLLKLAGMKNGRDLVEEGLAANVQDGTQMYVSLRNFFAAPEGRRLVALARGQLTVEQEQQLAQASLRVEKGSEHEWIGDTAASLASLDLLLLPAGGALFGKALAHSALAVRAMAAAARALQAAQAVRGLGIAVRVGEKAIVWSPGKLKILQAAEKAGKVANLGRALARGTLTLGATFGRFVGAAYAAEKVVPGSGHMVMAACFVIPGAMAGFSQAVGKGVSEAFAKAGGNMAVGEMPEITRAYLLFLRASRPQAEVAVALERSLAGQGMGAAEAKSASEAFAKDLYEGGTARELEKAAAEGKSSIWQSLKEWMKAKKEMVRPTRESGVPLESELMRRKGLEEATAALRESLGVDKLLAVPKNAWRGVSEGVRRAVTGAGETFTNAGNRVLDLLKSGKNLGVEGWTNMKGLMETMKTSLGALSSGPRAIYDRGVAYFQKLYRLVRQEARAQGNADMFPEARAVAQRGVEGAKKELLEHLGVDKLLRSVSVAKEALGSKMQAAAEGFVAAREKIAAVLRGGGSFAKNSLDSIKVYVKNLVEHVNTLASGPRQLWRNAVNELKDVYAALGKFRETRAALNEARAQLRLNTPAGEKIPSMLLRSEEKAAAEARTALREALGPVGKSPEIPANLAKAVRKAAVGVRAKLETARGSIVSGANVSLEKAGNFITARRQELGKLWTSVNNLSGTAKEWGVAQWTRLSNALESFASGVKEKGAKVADAAGEYRAARRLAEQAKDFGKVGEAKAARGVAEAKAELIEVLGLKRLSELPANLRAFIARDAQKTGADFMRAFNALRDGGQVTLDMCRNMVRGLNALAKNTSTGAREAWGAARSKYREVANAFRENAAANRLLKQAEKEEGGVLLYGQAGLRRAQAGKEQAAQAVREAVGLTKIAKLKNAMLQELDKAQKNAVIAFRTDFNRFVEKFSALSDVARRSEPILAEARALAIRLTPIMAILSAKAAIKPLMHLFKHSTEQLKDMLS